MKKILVVGGGVVGITAAYFAKQKDNNVTLIEADNELGGLLKSECNEAGCFDYGTHITNETGVVELDDFLFSDLNKENSYKFNVGESGNFFEGKLSDISPYVNTHHLSKEIYEKGNAELMKCSNYLGNNLKETLINRYGNTFYQNIFKNFINRTFGCSASQLSSGLLWLLDMNRVLVSDKEITIKLKKKDKNLDEKIGFHSATKGVTKFYPKKGGIGFWIKQLEEKIKTKNIEIKKDSSVIKIDIVNNKFLLHINNEIIEADELIWTVSSGLLNRFINTGIVGDKPNFRQTAVYDFVFDKPLKTSNYYINVYDKKLLSNRITCYQNLQLEPNFYACTVEVLNDNDFNFEQATNDIKQELSKIGIVEKNNQCIFSKCIVLKEGFPALTNTTVKTLSDINNYYENNYPNITLLGRSSAKGFFMTELLISAYKEMKNI
jgi:protoporphyrinogen oxidase